MKSRAGLIITLLGAGFDPAQILVKLALRRALAGCESVLDIGCGVTMTMRHLGVNNSVGLEGYPPSLEEATRLKTHDRLVPGDVRELGSRFQPKEFDASMAMDVIEHLSKEDGLKLMRDMERVARKRVVLFTPSGFLPQGHTDADDLQPHLSGWDPEEMRGHGYRVIGLLGPKNLRGEYHALKHRPKLFWGVVSLLCHLVWTRWKPKKAAAILCVKELRGA